jgi:hypothetical protein
MARQDEMADKPMTIEFRLPQGDPQGVRIACITTGTVQAVLVPRSMLTGASKRKELKMVGVYFLFGESEDLAKPVVYIGESEDCLVRLKQHDEEFWQQAIAIVSMSQEHGLTKTDVKYLEWYCINKAREVGRYTLNNGNDSAEPFVTEAMRPLLMNAFETLSILTSSLGFPVVEPRTKAAAKDVFVLTGADCEGNLRPRKVPGGMS